MEKCSFTKGEKMFEVLTGLVWFNSVMIMIMIIGRYAMKPMTVGEENKLVMTWGLASMMIGLAYIAPFVDVMSFQVFSSFTTDINSQSVISSWFDVSSSNGNLYFLTGLVATVICGKGGLVLTMSGPKQLYTEKNALGT